jgi:hypothetical protein
MAEREGFEPPIGLHLCRISSAVHSTTLPPLLRAPNRGRAPVVGACSRRGWRARQGRRGENQAGFPVRGRDVAAVMEAIADFGGDLHSTRLRPKHRAPARAGSAARRITVTRNGVGPPDAVNTGGPVPLIKILTRKGGFAGQVRRRFDRSVQLVRRNAIRSLT